MWNALIPVVGAVLVALIAAGAEVITSRNDRARAHQEVDLLRKLDPTIVAMPPRAMPAL